MRIIVSDFISLDGVVQAPGGATEDTDGGFGHGGWSMPFFDSEVMGPELEELAKHCTGLLQGRRTWQASARAWPGQKGDPFSDWINSVQKYVVSDTLTEADLTWKPTTIIRGADLVNDVSALRERSGGALLVSGSASVARALLSADLVDELALMLEPIVLGGGKSIYPYDGQARRFELTSLKTASTGVLVCRYQRVR